MDKALSSNHGLYPFAPKNLAALSGSARNTPTQLASQVDIPTRSDDCILQPPRIVIAGVAIFLGAFLLLFWVYRPQRSP